MDPPKIVFNLASLSFIILLAGCVQDDADEGFTATGFGPLHIESCEVGVDGKAYVIFINSAGDILYHSGSDGVTNISMSVTGSDPGIKCRFEQDSWNRDKSVRRGEEQLLVFTCPLPGDTIAGDVIDLNVSIGFIRIDTFNGSDTASGLIRTRIIPASESRYAKDYETLKAVNMQGFYHALEICGEMWGDKKAKCFNDMLYHHGISSNKSLCIKHAGDVLEACGTVGDFEEYPSCEECLKEIAINRSDESLCAGLSRRRDECYFRIAVAKDDISLCEKLTVLGGYSSFSSIYDRDTCYERFAIMRNDPSICYKLKDDPAFFRTREKCLASLESMNTRETSPTQARATG